MSITILLYLFVFLTYPAWAFVDAKNTKAKDGANGVVAITCFFGITWIILIFAIPAGIMGNGWILTLVLGPFYVVGFFLYIKTSDVLQRLG